MIYSLAVKRAIDITTAMIDLCRERMLLRKKRYIMMRQLSDSAYIRAIGQEDKEYHNRLIKVGAAIEHEMKDLTGLDVYPAEGESFEEILTYLRTEYKNKPSLPENPHRRLQLEKKLEEALGTIVGVDVWDEYVRASAPSIKEWLKKIVEKRRTQGDEDEE